MNLVEELQREIGSRPAPPCFVRKAFHHGVGTVWAVAGSGSGGAARAETGFVQQTYIQIVNTGVGFQEQRDSLSRLAHSLMERESVEAIILAGTDLALLFNESNTDFPHVDAPGYNWTPSCGELWRAASRCRKLDVNVSAQPHVVGQIPADMIRVVIDHDLIAVPQPVATKANIVGSDTKVEPTEPEAAGTAAGEPPNMALSQFPRKAPMLEWMIQVIVRIIGTTVVANPLVARCMNVRCFGMAGLVGECLVFGGSRRVLLGAPGPALGRATECARRRRPYASPRGRAAMFLPSPAPERATTEATRLEKIQRVVSFHLRS